MIAVARATQMLPWGANAPCRACRDDANGVTLQRVTTHPDLLTNTQLA
jgi:hypothetical protein